MKKDSLNSSIKKGIVWTGLDFVGKAGLQFLLQLILAKLLVPSDFGIIGMAMVFSVIIQAFVDFGFAAALIQMSEEDISESTYNTAFWTGFGLNIIVYLILCFVLGPIAADFYNEPLLVKIFPILSLNIIFNSFNIIQLVKITRQLEFNKLAATSFTGNLVACIVSVTMAYMGFGLWSIAINGAVIALVSLPIYYYFNRWIPKFIWKKEEFTKIFSFGVYTTGTQLANNITSQVDYLLIGKLVDKHNVGIYSFSFQITSIIRSAVVGIVSKVMYPVYAKIREDKPALRNYYGQIVKFNTLVVSSIMVIIFLYTEPILQFVYGNKWNEAIDIIKILSVSSIVTVMAGSNTSLIRALGYASLEFRIQLFKTFLLYVPSILIGTYFYGIVGTAWSILLNGVISVFIAMYFMNKLIGFNYYDLLKSIYKVVVICAITYLFYLFLNDNFVLSLSVSIAIIFILSFLGYKKELKKLKL